MFENENAAENADFNLEDFNFEGEDSNNSDAAPASENADSPENKEAENSESEHTENNENADLTIQDSDIKKFKNEDGTINQDALSQLLQEKSDLEKQAGLVEQYKNEREDFARNLGYDNYEKLQVHHQAILSNMQFAKYEANEYAKYLQYSSDPQSARGLLIQYAENPTPELQSEIESQFDVSVIKRVTQDLEKFKGEVEQKRQTQEVEQYKAEAREFVTDAITRYKERFENESFKELFGECIKFAGNKFSIDHLNEIVTGIEQAAIKNYLAKEAETNENTQTVKGLQNTSPQSKKVDTSVSNADISSMSAPEIDKLVQGLI